MRANKSKGTKPELIVRSLAHRMGYRFRLHRKDLPGTPDLVFPSLKKVVFVHGCFWHSHEDGVCKAARQPTTRIDYWQPKLARNVARAEGDLAELAILGWDVLVIWECWLKDMNRTASVLDMFLSERLRVTAP